MVRFLKPDINTSQDLSSAVLSYTTSIAKAFKLDQIIIKASVNITETITITLISAKGTNYNAVLRKRSLSAEQNFVYKPEGGSNYQAGDEIKVECTKANSTGTVYLTIKTSEIS